MCMRALVDVDVHAQDSACICKALTNQAVQCQRLSENENQDHTHEQLGLLSVGPAQQRDDTYRVSS